VLARQTKICPLKPNGQKPRIDIRNKSHWTRVCGEGVRSELKCRTTNDVYNKKSHTQTLSGGNGTPMTSTTKNRILKPYQAETELGNVTSKSTHKTITKSLNLNSGFGQWADLGGTPGRPKPTHDNKRAYTTIPQNQIRINSNYLWGPTTAHKENNLNTRGSRPQPPRNKRKWSHFWGPVPFD